MEMMVREKFDIDNRRVKLPPYFLERMGKKDAKQVIFTVEGSHIYIQPLNRMEIIKIDKEFAIREIFNTEKFDRRVQIPKELFDELGIKECKQIILTIPDKKHISVTFIRLDKPEKPKKNGRRNLTERNILDMFEEPEEEPESEESKYTTPEQWASMVIHDRIHNVKFNPYEYRWHSTNYDYVKGYFTAKVNGRAVRITPQDARNGGEILWKRLSIQEKESLEELKGYIQSYIDSRPDNYDLFEMEEDKKFITFLTLLIAKGIITKSDDSTLRQRYEKYRNFMLEHYELSFNFDYKYRLKVDTSNF